MFEFVLRWGENTKNWNIKNVINETKISNIFDLEKDSVQYKPKYNEMWCNEVWQNKMKRNTSQIVSTKINLKRIFKEIKNKFFWFIFIFFTDYSCLKPHSFYSTIKQAAISFQIRKMETGNRSFQIFRLIFG